MSHLLKPWTLDSLSLRNRIWMAPVKTAYGTVEGRVTERHLHFYRRIAEGGAGLILIEPVPVRPEGREHPRQLSATHPCAVEDLARIAAVIHKGGAKAGLNLNHAGRAANPKASGRDVVAPAACACPAKGTSARALEAREIQDILTGFGEAAAVAEKAGFDWVEIQAGHGYLLQQFMDPKINGRSDAYGLDPLRFAREVLDEVRGACRIAFGLRVTLASPDDDAERERLASLLEYGLNLGAAAVHVGMGDACTAPPWYYHHGALPEAPQEEALRTVRALTSLPVVAAGRMGAFERAERLAEAGMADAIALGRPLVADPELPSKWARGAFDEVVACGSCLQGCLAKVVKGEGISCIVNPTLGRPPLAPATTLKQALVAGAGPAGLAAALSLRERGHAVVIAEASGQLGGTFRAAPLSPGKESMAKPLEGFLGAVRRAKIPVIFNQKVDESFLGRVRPDVLIWAVGAEPSRPPIEGLDSLPVRTSKEYYLDGLDLPGRRILVLGGGLVGLEAAEKLGREGREVIVVEMLPETGGTMEPVGKALLLKRLKAISGVEILTSTTVERIGNEGVSLGTPGGARTIPPVDAVLLAAGLRADSVPDGVRAAVAEIHVVGDAKAPRDVESAVREGYEVGAAV